MARPTSATQDSVLSSEVSYVAEAVGDLFERSASMPLRAPRWFRNGLPDFVFPDTPLRLAFDGGTLGHGGGDVGAPNEDIDTSEVVLTDNAVNWIAAKGSQHLVSTTGWPVPTAGFFTPLGGVCPLFKVWAAGGRIVRIDDYRPPLLLMTGEGSVNANNLGRRIRSILLQATVAPGGDIGDTISVSIQLTIAGTKPGGPDSAFAHTFYVVEFFLADSAGGGESGAAPSGGMVVATGTLLETLSPVRILAKTNTLATLVVDVTHVGPRRWWAGAIVRDVVHYSAPPLEFV